MNRPRQPAGAPRQHQRIGLPGRGLPPLATLTLRFATGPYVDIHCRPRTNGMLAVHITRYADTADEQETAEVVQPPRHFLLVRRSLTRPVQPAQVHAREPEHIGPNRG